MYGSPFSNNNRSKTSTPSHFRDSARNAIYQQLPPSVITSPPANGGAGGGGGASGGAASIRSAPPLNHNSKYQMSHRSSSSSIFSSISGKRSVRSAPSIYSSSTATIPEDSEPISTTVEQLVNDIALHESHFQQQQPSEKPVVGDDLDPEEMYKISLGSDLQYQNVSESLIDWNLNVTRCKLIITQLPVISTIPDFQYNQNALPQLIGDLASSCHIVLIQPHISDKELIYTLFTSNLYQEHNLDTSFKKSVAEISVKQSRLLQINSGKGISQHQHSFLKFKFKEIAIRNYLINLAAAATTAHEYKLRLDQLKMELRTIEGKKVKLSKEDKKQLWEKVRSDVFQRAGLE
ncbi:transcription factor [Spathaspora passalidarum NRRL Y-27907]|uniref:Transcription factor n=1 Tax=Spathaspora passalidarum (strain NRRL Y-27907 / 11-Y1) TaxID=619300 RepID=G3AS27_SPAPN|nr:transcription factor [Spathaspora passalidarum NRRL Y-27907]EGW31877.1 transcription factor [Spathaspora passalidarum NRRL Y-27907]